MARWMHFVEGMSDQAAKMRSLERPLVGRLSLARSSSELPTRTDVLATVIGALCSRVLLAGVFGVGQGQRLRISPTEAAAFAARKRGTRETVAPTGNQSLRPGQRLHLRPPRRPRLLRREGVMS